MKRKTVLAIFLAVITPLLWLSSGGSPNWADHSQAMGQKVAGGWLAKLVLPWTSAEVLFNLTSDGCMIINCQLLESIGEDGGLGMNTTAHGTWKRTGPDQIEAFVLLFEQDDSGKTIYYEKARFYLTLKEGGTVLDGPMEIGVASAPVDPLDPDTEWWLIDASCTARALR